MMGKGPRCRILPLRHRRGAARGRPIASSPPAARRSLDTPFWLAVPCAALSNADFVVHRSSQSLACIVLRAQRLPRSMKEVLRAIGPASLARVVTLPISAIATGVSAYLTVKYAGAEPYGYVSLISTLFLLVPFFDFGLGAVVTNVVATRQQAKSPMVLATIGRVLRLLCIISGGFAIIVVTLGVLGQWPRLVGIPQVYAHEANAAIVGCLLLFLASIPFGIGQRILIGAARNQLLTYISILGPIAALAATAAGVWAKIPPLFLAVSQTSGLLLVAVISFVAACRTIGVSPVSLFGIRERSHVDALSRTAIPYLLISIGIPLATQSDRMVLAHLSAPASLASYSLGAQMYAPCFSVISSGSIALWPFFHREGVRLRQSWSQALKVLGFLGVIVGLGYLFLSGPASQIISRDRIDVPISLALPFAVLIVTMALHQASAMLLTSPRELKYQAACVLVMFMINVPLSILLAIAMGAAGPVWASCIAITFAQLLPGLLRAGRFSQSRTRTL